MVHKGFEAFAADPVISENDALAMVANIFSGALSEVEVARFCFLCHDGGGQDLWLGEGEERGEDGGGEQEDEEQSGKHFFSLDLLML